MMNALPPSSPGVARVVGALGGRQGPLQPGVATPPSRSIIGMEGKRRMAPRMPILGALGSGPIIPYAAISITESVLAGAARDVPTDGSSLSRQRRWRPGTYGVSPDVPTKVITCCRAFNGLAYAPPSGIKPPSIRERLLLQHKLNNTHHSDALARSVVLVGLASDCQAVQVAW